MAYRSRGILANDSAKMPVKLNIGSSDSATLALGDNPAERIMQMQSEGAALTGVSKGFIDSPDAIRTEAKTLKIKLMLYEGKLVGTCGGSSKTGLVVGLGVRLVPARCCDLILMTGRGGRGSTGRWAAILFQ